MLKKQLTKDQYAVLKFIKQYYDQHKNGCLTAKLIASSATLGFLQKEDLIFKTKEGHFPTTEGQEFVRLTERNTYERGKKYKLKLKNLK